MAGNASWPGLTYANASKYCPDSTVTVRTRLYEGKTRVMVADTGPGIGPKQLPRIFERFFRVDPGRSRDMGGTGLGLSIVKHLVEALGGTILVESELGRGSRFSCWIPREPPPNLPRPPAAAAAQKE